MINKYKLFRLNNNNNKMRINKNKNKIINKIE